MRTQLQLAMLLAAGVLLIMLLLGCNSVRIEVPAGATVEAGAIVIEQAAYKSAAGQGNGIEALTSPSTEARIGLK